MQKGSWRLRILCANVSRTGKVTFRMKSKDVKVLVLWFLSRTMVISMENISSIGGWIMYFLRNSVDICFLFIRSASSSLQSFSISTKRLASIFLIVLHSVSPRKNDVWLKDQILLAQKKKDTFFLFAKKNIWCFFLYAFR